MTVSNGVLLFDTAEEPINGWENQLGYRGYIEVWEKENKRIEIDIDEDSSEDEPVWEVLLCDDNGVNLIDYGYGFEEADKIAKEYMREN